MRWGTNRIDRDYQTSKFKTEVVGQNSEHQLFLCDAEMMRFAKLTASYGFDWKRWRWREEIRNGQMHGVFEIESSAPHWYFQQRVKRLWLEGTADFFDMFWLSIYSCPNWPVIPRETGHMKNSSCSASPLPSNLISRDTFWLVHTLWGTHTTGVPLLPV